MVWRGDRREEDGVTLMMNIKIYVVKVVKFDFDIKFQFWGFGARGGGFENLSENY